MRKLKKLITHYLRMVMILMVICIIGITLGLHTLNEQRRAREAADITFGQIEQLLEQNQKELEETKDEYRQRCLYNAEGIAYIIQDNPAVLEDIDELKKIAEFMEVDEIHIFDKTGRIYAGTHPEYYDLTFDSGEQMAFFKPMLEDKSLELCQEITPNTAEGKPMQYSALWSADEEFIVQVGMEPVNVMRVTEKNELSYIFSMLRVNPRVEFYAVDRREGTVKGSVNLEDVGKNAGDIGLNMDEIEKGAGGFHGKIKGKKCYCVFKVMGDNYIGRVVPDSILYQNIPMEITEIGICLTVVAIVLVFIVSAYMNRYVVNGINDVNIKLRKITKGDLKERIDVHNSLEFSELSSHINDMIDSILANTEMMTNVMERTNLRIGVYGYKDDNTEKISYTERVPDILALSEDDGRLADSNVFKKYINDIRKNPVENEEGVFCLEGEEKSYVKIDEIIHHNKIMGMVMDVTEEVSKRKMLEEERDIDMLTGLYNRRGFENKLSCFFCSGESRGICGIVMIDADGLKGINDSYGHDKGDIYLLKIADILRRFDREHCVASRQGGDEFILLLHNYSDESELKGGIDRLREMRDGERVKLTDGVEVKLSFSMGYCEIKEVSDIENVIETADKRMYENKRLRKSREKQSAL